MNNLACARAMEGIGSGVYVDVENLGGAESAKKVITSLIDHWPESIPVPTLLALYVRADHADLWLMWAEAQFPKLGVRSNGVQHFSTNQAKNSADIAMAVDAMTDILLERIGFVAVVSDDSDFISLFSKIRSEQSRLGFEKGNVPFLWVLTDRPGTRSTTIRDYFPSHHLHTVQVSGSGASPNGLDTKADSVIAVVSGEIASDGYEQMVIAIIDEIPLGSFKSTDTQEIIKRRWPNHALSIASKQSYGEEFRKRLLPLLSQRGVIEPNVNKRPREYEMTSEAKASLV